MLLLSFPWWVRLVWSLIQVSWWEGLVPAHWWVELGPRPLVGRGMSRGGSRHRKSLGSPSTHGWGCVPTQFAFWPEESQHWSLQAIGWSQILVPKCQPPEKLTQMNAPQYVCHQCLCPQGEPQLPSASPGDPPRPAGRYGPGSYQITSFGLCPGVHETVCDL